MVCKIIVLDPFSRFLATYRDIKGSRNADLRLVRTYRQDREHDVSADD
jgi:hypothetical protein